LKKGKPLRAKKGEKMKKIIQKSLVSPQAILGIAVLILAGLAIGTPNSYQEEQDSEFVLDEVVIHSNKVVIHSGEELTLDEVIIHASSER